MALYDYGGIFDFLEDIHFPNGAGRRKNLISKPWFFWLPVQQPMAFSFLANTWGPGWVYRANRSVIKILAVDSQPIVPLSAVGNDTLEGAMDRVVTQYDRGDPLDPEFAGRFNFSNRFFWKVINRQFPKWATNVATLPTQKPGDIQHRPIADYIDDAVKDFMGRWNGSSLAYNSNSASIPADLGGALQGGEDSAAFDVLHSHSFAIPFPDRNLTFRQLGRVIAQEKAWFGPIPDTAWFPEFLILTQAYSYVYSAGQLDDTEWDMSRWPPRRTSIPQREGGSPRAPSAISGNYNGLSTQQFPDHQHSVP